MASKPISESSFVTAPRVHKALTANAEKKLLIWIAERMPGFVNSDHLTALGFVGQILAGGCYAIASINRYALLGAVFFIAVNWFGDSLDGTIARVRDQQRPRYGFYVDHMADTFGSVAIMCGLGFSGYLHWQVAIAMLLGFLILSIESFLTTYTLGSFHLSQAVFGPTEIRILLVIGTIRLLFQPYSSIFGKQFLLFDVGGVIASAVMLIMSVRSMLVHARELARLESVR